MSIHKGHRQRLKDRFLQEGLDSFTEAHALELLLFYAVPQKDTAPMAHALLEHFGSITGVLEAPASALEEIPGIGKNAATLIQLTTAMSRFYMVHRAACHTILPTVNSCGAYLLPRFLGRREEAVCALSLDARCKVLACKFLGQGSINSAGVPLRTIVEYALSSGATSLVLAHNHPSGIALPSQDDIDTTKRLAVALDAVGILLADHIIVADDDFVSMAASGLYQAPDAASVPCK